MTGAAGNIPATLDKLTVPIGDVRPRRSNPRQGNVDLIAESLARNGQYRPIVVNKPTGEVLAGNHCVDDQTEALTQRGWLSGDRITTHDTVLSCDATGQLRWSPVREVFRNPDYSGPMHYLHNKSLDALVSPGHKFLLDTGELRAVEDLRCHCKIVVMGRALADTAETYTDAFVELVGWATTPRQTPWPRSSASPGPDVHPIEAPFDTLVSFHYFGGAHEPVVADLARAGCAVIGDSGAYSAMSLGKPIDLDKFCEWAERNRRHTLWVASLDAIGDPERSWANYQYMVRNGLPDVVPTVHFPAPPAALDRYGDRPLDLT